MSNCSDALLRGALLQRMAQEWRLLASEIAGLAETAGHGRILDADTMIRLQSFDAVIQNIHAQSRLLETVAAGADPAPTLDEVPLPGLRARLKAAIGQSCTARPAESGMVHLFANEAEA